MFLHYICLGLMSTSQYILFLLGKRLGLGRLRHYLLIPLAVNLEVIFIYLQLRKRFGSARYKSSGWLYVCS